MFCGIAGGLGSAQSESASAKEEGRSEERSQVHHQSTSPHVDNEQMHEFLLQIHVQNDLSRSYLEPEHQRRRSLGHTSGELGMIPSMIKQFLK